MAAGLPDAVFPVSVGESLLLDNRVFVLCVRHESLPDTKLSFTDCVNCHLYVYCLDFFFLKEKYCFINVNCYLCHYPSSQLFPCIPFVNVLLLTRTLQCARSTEMGYE